LPAYPPTHNLAALLNVCGFCRAAIPGDKLTRVHIKLHQNRTDGSRIIARPSTNQCPAASLNMQRFCCAQILSDILIRKVCYNKFSSRFSLRTIWFWLWAEINVSKRSQNHKKWIFSKLNKVINLVCPVLYIFLYAEIKYLIIWLNNNNFWGNFKV
jgi:hypothetical protein